MDGLASILDWSRIFLCDPISILWFPWRRKSSALLTDCEVHKQRVQLNMKPTWSCLWVVMAQSWLILIWFLQLMPKLNCCGRSYHTGWTAWFTPRAKFQLEGIKTSMHSTTPIFQQCNWRSCLSQSLQCPGAPTWIIYQDINETDKIIYSYPKHISRCITPQFTFSDPCLLLDDPVRDRGGWPLPVTELEFPLGSDSYKYYAQFFLSGCSPLRKSVISSFYSVKRFD